MSNIKKLQSEIIACLKQQGADLIGFGGVKRFESMGIQDLFPETKTVIGVVFRVLRGVHRGIEEGSTFYQYTTNAVEVLEENVMPRALLRGCGILEDFGYEALPVRRDQIVMKETHQTNPEVDYKEIYRGIHTEPKVDFVETAVLCGLGEQGLHGTLLTDDFGPLQRYAFILTNAELEETPLIEPHLCDQCGECVSACPGSAISSDGHLDTWQCAAYYMGASMKKNPFMPEDAFTDDPRRLEIISGEAKLSPEQAKWIMDNILFYPPVKQGYVSSMCGRACDRACYIHLEEKGVLSRKFHEKFRKRPEWELELLYEKPMRTGENNT